MPKSLPTSAALAAMTTAELVTAYNDLASRAGMAVVKRFESKRVGIERVGTVVAHLQQFTPAPPKAKPAKAKAPKGKPAMTMSERMRQLILKGKSDAQVWAIVQPEYGMPDSHKSYPSGQRRILIRQKKLTEGA